MFQIIKPGTVIPFMKIAKLVEAIFLTAVLIFAFVLGFKGLN